MNIQKVDMNLWFQLFFTWDDWAAPVRINLERINKAIEIQIESFHFIVIKDNVH